MALYMAKILIVDDEIGIRDIIKEYLDFADYEYKDTDDGMKALQLLEQEDFDLVVLDIMMPGIDGISVLKELRKNRETPVILLTARGNEYDKLIGFEMGADDYLSKPFSPKELLARIKSVLKRTNPNNQKTEDKLVFNEMVIDIAAHRVTVKGNEINLTPKEFELLLCLCKKPNVVFNRTQILSEVWGYDFYGDDRTVDTHIKMLRSNLGEYRSTIKTVWGIGYKFEI